MRAQSLPPLEYWSPARRTQAQSHLRGQQGRFRIAFWEVLICGCITFGRAFGHLFLAEMFIVYNVVRNPRNWLGRFVDDAVRCRPLPLAIALNILWGLFEVFRCVYIARPIGDTLRGFAFDIYPIVILIGINMGETMPVERFVRFWKTCSVFYCLYALALLGGAGGQFALPGTDIELFTNPAFASLPPLALLVFWGYLRDWKLRHVVLMISILPLLFEAKRGSTLAFLIGVGLLGMVSPRRILTVALGGVILAGFATLIGPFIPGKDGRAGMLDPTVNVARIIATVDEDKAYKMLMHRGYTVEAVEILQAKGTTQWRETIWTNAIHSLNSTSLQFLGQGFGQSLQDLVPDNAEIYTPHNFLIYALYYTGGIGVFLFCLMLLALFLEGRRIPHPLMRAMGLGLILGSIQLAAVGNEFETPYNAIPIYLIAGLCIGIRVPAGDEAEAHEAHEVTNQAPLAMARA